MNLTENHPNQDDEIDLIEVFKTIWDGKSKIFITTIIFTILGITYYFTTPKQYKSFVTFHLNESSQNQSSLANYAGLLGISSNSNLYNISDSLLKSDRIKIETAKKHQNYFNKEISKAISTKKIKNTEDHINFYVIKKLKLKKNISIDISKNKLIKLSYYFKDPILTKKVIETYVKLLENFNKELEISAEKKFITIIDIPKKAIFHFKPKLLNSIIFSSLLGLFFSFFIVLKNKKLTPKFNK